MNKLTVLEAMRLRDQIYGELEMAGYTSDVSYGTNTENGIEVDDKGRTSITDHLVRVKDLMAMSLEANNVVDNFNKTNGISSLVRRRIHNEKLLEIYQNAQTRSKPVSRKTREKLQTEIKVVEKVFTPTLTKTDIKSAVKVLKAESREIQNKIDTLNRQTVEFSFSFDDFEDLRLGE